MTSLYWVSCCKAEPALHAPCFPALLLPFHSTDACLPPGPAWKGELGKVEKHRVLDENHALIYRNKSDRRNLFNLFMYFNVNVFLIVFLQQKFWILATFNNYFIMNIVWMSVSSLQCLKCLLRGSRGGFLGFGTEVCKATIRLGPTLHPMPVQVRSLNRVHWFSLVTL